MLTPASAARQVMYYRGHFSNQFSTGLFWKNAPPRDHVVQVYRDENILLDALEGFVGSGLRGEDATVVIATAGHVHELEKRLRVSGLDLDRMRWQNRYHALLAEEYLRGFMVNGWPDEELFADTVSDLLKRARGEGRHVRIFGEMVAVLWGRGLYAATLRLEQLWNKLVHREGLLVFCAYPQPDPVAGDAIPFDDICAQHTRVIPG
jgi:hypothetical protein